MRTPSRTPTPPRRRCQPNFRTASRSTLTIPSAGVAFAMASPPAPRAASPPSSLASSTPPRRSALARARRLLPRQPLASCTWSMRWCIACRLPMRSLPPSAPSPTSSPMPSAPGLPAPLARPATPAPLRRVPSPPLRRRALLCEPTPAVAAAGPVPATACPLCQPQRPLPPARRVTVPASLLLPLLPPRARCPTAATCSGTRMCDSGAAARVTSPSRARCPTAATCPGTRMYDSGAAAHATSLNPSGAPSPTCILIGAGTLPLPTPRPAATATTRTTVPHRLLTAPLLPRRATPALLRAARLIAAGACTPVPPPTSPHPAPAPTAATVPPLRACRTATTAMAPCVSARASRALAAFCPRRACIPCSAPLGRLVCVPDARAPLHGTACLASSAAVRAAAGRRARTTTTASPSSWTRRRRSRCPRSVPRRLCDQPLSLPGQEGVYGRHWAV